MNNPRVSIIIAGYNHAKYLAKSVESALNQTVRDIEVIFIDDCSSDGTAGAIRAFDDPRLRYIRHDINRGPSAAFNTAIQAARGEYITILSADDILSPNKTETQLALMKTLPARSVVFSLYDRIGEDGQPLPPTPHDSLLLSHNSRTPAQRLSEFFHYGNYLPALTVLLPRSLFDEVGLFDLGILQLQDFDMWLRAAVAGYQLVVCPQILAHYRIRDNEGNLSAGHEMPYFRNCIEMSWVMEAFLSITDPQLFAEIFPQSPRLSAVQSSSPSLMPLFWALEALDDGRDHLYLFASRVFRMISSDPALMEAVLRSGHCNYRQFFTPLTDNNISVLYNRQIIKLKKKVCYLEDNLLKRIISPKLVILLLSKRLVMCGASFLELFYLIPLRIVYPIVEAIAPERLGFANFMGRRLSRNMYYPILRNGLLACWGGPRKTL